MPVIGTAGHVDHGKSTLILALSGRDPDRWREEKERGLTIDLGFAWSRIGEQEVSFVDVPGHERYSKNMLAGIEAIDVALLVVAADEGWMPQSEEHLAVLDLLGVERGVVALTKIDRVDDELADLAELEVTDKLEGTSLAGAEIVRVSASTGQGVDDIRAALARAVARVPDPDQGRPRLWVDRSFSAVGAGTVATGTLLGGSVELDMRLEVFPGRREGRIRGIQSHEHSHTRIDPGRRAALNLAGIDVDEIPRGSMLGRPGEWRETSRFAVELRAARYVDELKPRGAYHIHLGSGAWPARLRPVEDTLWLIDVDTALPLSVGDRFILRDTGRRLVVGGGRVVDPSPPKVRRLRTVADTLRAALDGSPDDRAAALLSARGRDMLANLERDSGGGSPPDAVVVDQWAFTEEEAFRITDRLAAEVDAFHQAHPLRPGLPIAEGASKSGVELGVLTALVQRDGRLAIDGAHVRSTSFIGVRSADQELRWQRVRTLLEESGPAVPRLEDLDVELELIHALVRDGELVRVSDEFVYLPTQIDELTTLIREMDSPFTVSEFRDRSGLSRKYAVPLLEWADRAGLTVRQGDTRRVR